MSKPNVQISHPRMISIFGLISTYQILESWSADLHLAGQRKVLCGSVPTLALFVVRCGTIDAGTSGGYTSKHKPNPAIKVTAHQFKTHLQHLVTCCNLIKRNIRKICTSWVGSNPCYLAALALILAVWNFCTGVLHFGIHKYINSLWTP